MMVNHSAFQVLGVMFGSWLLVATTGSLEAQEAQESNRDQELKQQRLELMQQRVKQFTILNNQDADFPQAFEPKPIFRYDDPARGYVAAAIWRLGEQGRPLAILSTELQPRYSNKPRIVYEYLSLTDQPFSATSPDYRWQPQKSAVEFKAIPNSPAPAMTPALRLTQMRTEARRFSAYEIVGKQRFELRLLPQPCERYTPSMGERADGAIFVLAVGTNPEALLFIESDGTKWNFAIGRLAGASRMVAQIDEMDVWEIGGARYSPAEPYTASNAHADIPGISPDGNPLPAP